ncbi:HutD family protein [Vagococcus elongatus]|nr:HutD family protein [Vagococcus elongatus]
MEIVHLTSADYKLSNWSGGKTREIFLSPFGGNYELRAFDFRISSAVIELQQSEFTPLPNFKRKLMPLTDSITLKQNEQVIELKPFDVFSFDGSIPTTSYGQCIDFNLIYKKTMVGEMYALDLQPGSMAIKNDCFLYFLDDCILKVNGQIFSLKKDETLNISKVEQPFDLEILETVESSKLIYVSCI